MFTLPLTAVFIQLLTLLLEKCTTCCDLHYTTFLLKLFLAYWMNPFILCSFSEWERAQPALTTVFKDPFSR